MPKKPKTGFTLVELLVVIAISPLLSGLECQCQEAMPAWKTNFVAYMTNRPWVAGIEYEWSRNHESVNGKLLEGMQTFKASLQPGGFFLQSTTNFPNDHLLTSGESASNYWGIGLSGIGFAPKRPELGGSASNSIQIISFIQKQQLLDVLNLGIANLDASTIQWSSPTQFIADSLIDNEVPSKIRGQIEAFDRGLPSRLRYSDDFFTNEEQVISYHYFEPFLPPGEMTVQVLKNHKKIKTMETVIEDIEFGLRPEAQQGFLPSAFLAPGYVPKIILIQSNALRYAIQPDGSLRLYEPTKEQLAIFNGTASLPGQPSASHWLFFVVLLVGGIITLLLLVCKRRMSD